MRYGVRQPRVFTCSNANGKEGIPSVTVYDNAPVNPFIPQEMLLRIVREESGLLGKHMKNLWQRCCIKFTWGLNNYLVIICETIFRQLCLHYPI